ncbi:MAG: bifunctional proline dehydrogenase/L-glutamate gamma-semialdehyde dehydrogenase PutA [Sneathiella sp.]|nr:bifunctional proline dehydrogenase/L-glutamate gamma-semialdehyde dehydrogenase PutA [Sneathiella sp.]
MTSGSAAATIRKKMRNAYLCNEDEAIKSLVEYTNLNTHTKEQLVDSAAEFVRVLRRSKNPGLMEIFLSEYGLSTEEGVALMCLAEALLRVPDDATIDVLIQDKISAADWGKHLGHSTSPLVNASTWALMLTGKVISPKEADSWDVVQNVRHLIRRVGEPVIRNAVSRAMKVLGHQFVLGRNIKEAMKRGGNMEEKGYQYSYDMLGEAAHTATDAKKYFLSYSRAISQISERSTATDIRDNPAISVKLSALHPRYEFTHKKRVMDELVPRVSSLVLQAKNANMGFTIDAEEADRLDLSLDVIEAVLSVPDLAGWDGFGLVVQAYSPRAIHVLDWCYDLATRLDRKIMIRLVKGAYWDTEIKLAQVEGLSAYPVFTMKAATDISYTACAKKLLSMTDRIYPQFATHNAHTMATVLHLAGTQTNLEFQRLHGMGEALHNLVKARHGGRCRIYAPVGIHEDLLAYLVRRLLENGANSSFVNQVLDEKVPAKLVVSDPEESLKSRRERGAVGIPLPTDIYPMNRINSSGINFANPDELSDFEKTRQQFKQKIWTGAPVIGGSIQNGAVRKIYNPSDKSDFVGEIVEATEPQILVAFNTAQKAQPDWAATEASARADAIRKVADLLEENRDELMALLAREAGKTPFDALGEVREAVDFCRFYAQEAPLIDAEISGSARGVFVCISPWNFPLAIFMGQVVAALVTGNAVLAKPAEQTSLVAAFAVDLMHKAGIPANVLHFLPGKGAVVGQALVSHPTLAGVCFTGSTNTAQRINRAMADNGSSYAPLIAETGGLNAMIVDSTALPEQVVGDIVASAFQSAGQRCSALRMLYVQEDIADKIIPMLEGAMDDLSIGDPWSMGTDLGPVIDPDAKQNILNYCDALEAGGQLIKKLTLSKEQMENGYFIAPSVFKVFGIEEMEREIFGPVLHVATFKSGDLKKVVHAINDAGYGLTMGLHTRVDRRVQEVAEIAEVGNLYVNRNQIGAVVGVQPFGGEGLSGTGPKAGGPLYLHKFVGRKPAQLSRSLVKHQEGPRPTREERTEKHKQGLFDSLHWIYENLPALERKFQVKAIQIKNRLNGYTSEVIELVGPTGESNQLQFHKRGTLLVAGCNWLNDALVALATGNSVLIFDQGSEASEFMVFCRKAGLPARVLSLLSLEEFQKYLDGFSLLSGLCLSVEEGIELKTIRQKLAATDGAIIPLLQSGKTWHEFALERTLSVDTTASGGNAALLASVEN